MRGLFGALLNDSMQVFQQQTDSARGCLDQCLAMPDLIWLFAPNLFLKTRVEASSPASSRHTMLMSPGTKQLSNYCL